LGFSLDTGLAMNSNRFARACDSAGKTRSPCRPTTIGSPLRTSVIGTQRALPPCGSTRMPQSISWSSTSIHSPPSRTCVR
jgi:hypothetical protein